MKEIRLYPQNKKRYQFLKINKGVFKLSNLVIAMVVVAFGLKQCKSPVNKTDLEQGFFIPSTENRPLALWPWLNGFVDTTKLVYELEQMKEKGMGASSSRNAEENGLIRLT